MNRLFAGLAIVLVLACRALAQPAEVIIIRHAEKPPQGNELSQQGRERAAALVPYFLETPDVLDFKKPVAIYAQAPKKESSVRSIQTVEPLANVLKLTINDSYTRDDFAKMVREIMNNEDYEGHTVLICWEHKVIPEIAKAFGVDDAPTKWPGAAFDRTWSIKFRPDKKPKFKDLPQRLMYGDSDD